MSINPSEALLSRPLPTMHQKISSRAAAHVAGHAVAICLGNRQKGLPPVFFQIRLKKDFRFGQSSGKFERNHLFYVPQLEGGRLINDLPFSLATVQKGMTADQKLEYQKAFEADIFNFLAGPIAEAKYVAICDDELISPRLLNLNALQNYDGGNAIQTVHKYFECINQQGEDKERFIIHLYLSAFAFVSEHANWQAITSLADRISVTQKSLITYEEIMSILEKHSGTTSRCTAFRSF